MNVYVDDQACTTVADAPDTIEALLEQLRPDILRQERMIVAVRCDRRLIPLEELEAILRRNPRDFARIDLETATIIDLSLETLQVAGEILQATRPKQAETIELLEMDNHAQALTVLADCIQGWSQAYDAVIKTVQLVNLDIERLTHDNIKITDILKQVAEQLTQLKDCLRTADYVMLTDLLQYEIEPAFDRWEGTVEAIRQAIRGSEPA